LARYKANGLRPAEKSVQVNKEHHTTSIVGFPALRLVFSDKELLRKHARTQAQQKGSPAGAEEPQPVKKAFLGGVGGPAGPLTVIVSRGFAARVGVFG